MVRSFGGGHGRGRTAVAPRTKYAELAPGGPSLEKKSNFLASWAFSKFQCFLDVFWTFLVVRTFVGSFFVIGTYFHDFDLGNITDPSLIVKVAEEPRGLPHLNRCMSLFPPMFSRYLDQIDLRSEIRSDQDQIRSLLSITEIRSEI